MKKSSRNKEKISKLNEGTAPLTIPYPQDGREKSLDTTKLTDDISEDFRNPALVEGVQAQKVNTTNWSQAEDRGEDLINERDPFLQQPERDTEIPPELIQQRAYQLYERGEHEGDNLADWFEAERQLRKEIRN